MALSKQNLKTCARYLNIMSIDFYYGRQHSIALVHIIEMRTLFLGIYAITNDLQEIENRL